VHAQTQHIRGDTQAGIGLKQLALVKSKFAQRVASVGLTVVTHVLVLMEEQHFAQG